MPGACSAPSCKYNTRTLHVFRFPRDVHRCYQWLINCHRLDLMEKSPIYLNTHFRLCEKHFEDDQFMNASKSRLIWRAIPTIFDAADPPESEKRRNFRHSSISAKQKRVAPLEQTFSADHTYFAALDKSVWTKEMKSDVAKPRPCHEGTICVVSANTTTSGLLETCGNANIATLYECSGNKITADDMAGSVNTNSTTLYGVSSSFGAVLESRSQTQSSSIADPYVANLAFENTLSDVAFLTDEDNCANSDVAGELNVNTDVMMFYTTSIRDEAIQDSRSWTATLNFEDSSNTNVQVIKFSDELNDGTSEGSMNANSGIIVPPNTSSITFCNSSSSDETLLGKQSMLPEATISVQHATFRSQKYVTASDAPGVIDGAAAAEAICESSRSATISSRKRKRRKVAALEIEGCSVDHTYATNALKKSFQGEGDCSCETFSKEQGMLLVQKILSMQKEALMAAKRSKRKAENPTVESIVRGAVQLGMKDSTSRFFASQLKNCVRNNKGNRWSALDKTFARDLFIKSKEAYKVLEDFFHLPSAATLQRHARARSCFQHSDEALP